MEKLLNIEIEVSGRHVHLSAEHLAVLFGAGYELRVMRELSQPGEFAAEEVVKLSTEKGELKLRVIGPVREKTQAEISRTDAVALGLNPPVRMSGDLENSEKAKLTGPNGEVELEEGVILASRHIHCPASFAEENGIVDGQELKVAVEGKRGLVFEHVKVKIKDGYEFKMHIDTDEANAAGISSGMLGRIID